MFFIAVLLLVTSISKSQSLKTLVFDPKAYGLETDYSVEMKANVLNTSATAKNVKVKLVMTSLTMGHQVSFCWGESCYPPKTEDFEMPNGEADAIKPNDTSSYGLKLDLVPNGTKGTSIIKIIFMVDGTPSDNTSFDAEFYVGVSGVDESEIYSVSLYPNPASTSLTINLKSISEALFILYDLNGNVIKTQNLNQGMNILNVSDCPSGDYFYTLSTGSKVIIPAKNLIITH